MTAPPAIPIEWRVHLQSAPEAVFDAWATDTGRECFWTECSTASPAGFERQFINGQRLHVEVTEEVSVLMALKAAVDFGVDLRAHDPARTWEGRYVDC